MLRRRLAWYMTKLNYTQRIDLNGQTFQIPHINGLQYSPNESWMTDVLRGLVSYRDGAFVDCGVNVGQTLLKVKSLQPERPYIGFEPNPACVYYLNELKRRNRLSYCDIVPAGIADRDGVATLYSYDESGHDSKASMRHDRGIDVVSTQHVATVSADTVESLVGEQPISIIKIDVEGLELDVTKSLLRLIERERPPVLMELLPVYSAESERKARQDEIEALFRSVGYAQFEIMRDESDSFAGVTAVETAGIRSDWSRCDYVFAPAEQHSQVETALGLYNA
ncbi:FkbM family methyltransferase [Salinisphaera sp. SPP-AMP-43]|uniref:FkbM family methyltransferase n=1 Tax=Salinisphaera sp. SPP-AMP-43 TaxID=3121288 RepID=UPI003C6DDE64